MPCDVMPFSVSRSSSVNSIGYVDWDITTSLRSTTRWVFQLTADSTLGTVRMPSPREYAASSSINLLGGLNRKGSFINFGAPSYAWVFYTIANGNKHMVLHIRRALGNGVSKTLTTAGLVFVVLIGIAQIVFLALSNTLAEAFVASLDLPAGTTETTSSVPLSLPISATMAGVLSVVVFLVLQVITIVLIRVMTADSPTITSETYTRRMGWVVLNSIVGGIVLGILSMVGFILLIIPGLFLTVSLLFTVIYIADEDENFFSAMKNSWSLASGNRWRLLGLYVAVFIAYMILSIVLGLVMPPASIVSQVVTGILSTILVVYLMAVLTDAYRQLRRDGQPEQETDPDPNTAV